MKRYRFNLRVLCHGIVASTVEIWLPHTWCCYKLYLILTYRWSHETLSNCNFILILQLINTCDCSIIGHILTRHEMTNHCFWIFVCPCLLTRWQYHFSALHYWNFLLLYLSFITHCNSSSSDSQEIPATGYMQHSTKDPCERDIFEVIT